MRELMKKRRKAGLVMLSAVRSAGLFRGFMARSVAGGVMVPVLQYPELVRRYRTP